MSGRPSERELLDQVDKAADDAPACRCENPSGRTLLTAEGTVLCRDCGGRRPTLGTVPAQEPTDDPVPITRIRNIPPGDRSRAGRETLVAVYVAPRGGLTIRAEEWVRREREDPQLGVTPLEFTHRHVAEAARIGQKVVVLYGRDARIRYRLEMRAWDRSRSG